MKKAGCERGLSLIEVMVALLIAGVMVGALVKLSFEGSALTVAARRDVAAVNLAQALIEEIKAVPDNQMGVVQGATADTVTLETRAAASDGFYDGYMLATTGGPGAGQTRKVAAYDGTARLATVSVPWEDIPEIGATTYVLFKSVVEGPYVFRAAIAANPGFPDLKTVTVAVYFPEGDRMGQVSLTTEKLRR